MKMDQTEKLILEAIDQHRDEIIEFARDIYDHGELGYKEFNTAEKFINNNFELNEIIVRNIPNKKMPKLNSPSNKIGEKTSTMNNEYIVILTKK